MKKLVVALLFSGLLTLFAAILPTIVGLGLSNGIARAAPSDTIAIDNIKLEDRGNKLGVHLQYRCAPDDRQVDISITVVQGNSRAHDLDEQVTCDDSMRDPSGSIDAEFGTFTKGPATATAEMYDPGAVLAKTTRTVQLT